MKTYIVKGSHKGHSVNAKVDNLDKAKEVALSIYGSIYFNKKIIMTYSEIKGELWSLNFMRHSLLILL